MEYQKEKIEKAADIFAFLLENKKLDQYNNPDLYNIYKDQYDVQEIVEIYEKANKVSIITSGSTVYLVPDDDNSFIGFKNQDYKDIVFRGFPQDYKRNDYIGLAHFIELEIMNMFFSSESKNVRRFINLEELENIVSTELKAAMEYEAKIEGNKGIYSRFYNIYNNIGVSDQDQSGTKTEKRTREGFIKAIINFYRDQELISYVDSELNVIEITEKFETIMNISLLDKKLKETRMKLLGGEDE